MAVYHTSKNWGGITDDLRSETGVSFDVIKNFDLSDSIAALTPHRNLEADDSGSRDIQAFEYANGTFYGLGVDTSAGTKIEFYTKSPLTTGSWSSATGGQSTGTSTLIGLPKHYKNYIYGVHQTNKVFQYGDITGTPSFTDGHGTLSHSPTFAGDPIIAKDDVLYIPYDNKLASIDGTTFTATVLTLPDNLTIRSLENWGSYLAIGCSGDGITVNSKMFLWNLIDADVTEVVDFGKEQLFHIGSVDGSLIGVSLSTSASVAFSQRIMVRTWSGGDKASVIFNKKLGKSGHSILPYKSVEENIMYFCLAVNSDAEPHTQGVWSVGRKNRNYPFRVNHELKSINDDIETNTNGFFKVGDYFWIAHGTTGEIERTSDTATYTATSLMETEKIIGSDISLKKAAIKMGVIFEQVSGGTVVLKYRVDSDSSWTTAFSASTTSATSAFSEILPDDWNEIQLRTESTGGAVVLDTFIEFEQMERR